MGNENKPGTQPTQVDQTRSLCVVCSRPFTRTPKEIERLKEKKIPLPTRCPQCRKLNVIEEKLKFIIKLLTQGKPQPTVKVVTEVTKVTFKKNGKQKLPTEPKQGVPSQTPA